MNISKRLKFMKNDEGSGLILTLMILMVISILGAALGTITVGSYNLGDVNRDDNSAYYIAEAGANMAYEEFNTFVNDSYRDNEVPTTFFNEIKNFISYDIHTNLPKIQKEYTEEFSIQFGSKPKAVIEVTENMEGNSRDYTITSTGTVEGKERTVTKDVTVTWIPKSNTGPGYGSLPSTATVAKDKLILNSGVEVSGNVYLDSPEGILTITDYSNNSNLDSLNVYVHSDIYDREAEKYNGSNVTIKERYSSFDWQVYDELINKFPIFPENPTYTEWPSELDTSNGDISIVVDELTLKQNSKIKITGDGRVDIYIKNNLSIEGNVELNSGGDADKLQLYYAGNRDKIVAPGNNFKFNGTLFVKEAKIDFSNGVVYEGLVISGGDLVNLGKSDLNALVIAPKAKVELDTSSNNNIIKGIIVGKEVELAQNMSIEFSEYYLANFPLKLPDTESDGDGSGEGSGESGSGSSEGELIITKPGVEN